MVDFFDVRCGLEIFQDYQFGPCLGVRVDVIMAVSKGVECRWLTPSEFII
jgi:hypothetical protein